MCYSEKGEGLVTGVGEKNKYRMIRRLQMLPNPCMASFSRDNGSHSSRH